MTPQNSKFPRIRTSIYKESDIIGCVPKCSKGALHFLRRAVMSLLAELMALTILLRYSKKGSLK